MSHTHRDFFLAFLSRLSLPSSTPALRALAVVSYFESDQGDNHWNNPLAVTLYWPNAVPYNTFGNNQHVWRYATFTDGVHASAQMYSGMHWAGVRKAIVDVADPDNHYTRNRVLDAFTAAYTWADIDFRHAAFNTVAVADARLAHILYGPPGTP